MAVGPSPPPAAVAALPSIVDLVKRLQADCSKPVKFIRAHPHGFGSMINYAMLSATVGWIQGKRVVFVPDAFTDEAKAYFDQRVCDDQRHKKNVLACLFKRLSPPACDAGDVKAYQNLVLGMKDPYAIPLHFEDLRGMRDATASQRVFQEAATTPWFWAKVHSLLFQPNAEFAASIKAQALADQRSVSLGLAKFVAASAAAKPGSPPPPPPPASLPPPISPVNGTEVFACVHMRGAEKFFDTLPVAPEVYARSALQKLVALKLTKAMGRRADKDVLPPYILLISEDEDRSRAFIKYIRESSSLAPVLSLSPIARHDSRKYLHVTQMVAAMQKCAQANAVIATISSNVARLLLYSHIQRYGGGNANASFTSLDRWQLLQHARANERPPELDLARPPYWPT